ncbi:MAG TPA: nodulation protein NfeD [Dehalococcoidia bacterium]|nr:nodulation protein NfeD [Dehalococcoidia bacterium]
MTFARLLRLSFGLALIALALLAGACGSGPSADPGDVHVLTADGDVGPIMSRYIDRGIGHAESTDAAAVVIRLDTPGGLSSSMDEIVQRIMRAKVPVIVYVWPSGGRAASAGTFITMASHVAAMAPGTSIGAASPVDISGGDIGGTLQDKATNDAAARIRDIARVHGRNEDWAESAVREATSAGAQEAKTLGVVEYVSQDLTSLLSQANGTSIALADGRKVTLATADAPLRFNDRTFVENFLAVIGDPNIALLLISLGTLAIFLELLHPGAIFPAVFGAISILFGFFALSVIPVNWAGVALVLLGIALIYIEVFVTSSGILAIGGAVALILGGFIFTTDNPEFAGPGMEVNRWLIIGLALGLATFASFILANIIQLRRQPSTAGVDSMLGQTGVARSPLDPEGYVMIRGEHWSATSDSGPVQPGESVVVTDVQGLRLRVRKRPEEESPREAAEQAVAEGDQAEGGTS